jgi:DnaK suppressor protein
VTDFPDQRALLRAEQHAALSRIAALERDFAGFVEAASSAGADDEHDPEGATTAFERQHVAALIGLAREQLGQVEEALGRIDTGSYGICVSCGQAIAAGRLAARPAASTCMSCASRRS